jgi:hypothetical protein
MTTTPTIRLRRAGLPGASAFLLLPAVLAAILAAAGMGRPYGFDESVTVDSFVTAPSFTAAFTRQVAFNNHPLMSTLDHGVFAVLGSRDELPLRVLPALILVSAVALLTGAAARRFGSFVGTVAGLLLAVNPETVALATAIRGYGLLLLCSIGSFLLLRRLRTSSSLTTAVALVLVSTLGMTAHAYMAVPLALLALYGWLEPPLRARRAYLWPMLGAALGALLIAATMLESVGASPRRFRPTFPIDTWRVLLGENHAIAMALTVLGLVGAWPYRRDRRALALLAALTTIALAVWAIAPSDLYPRFFCFLVPIACVGSALGLQTVARAAQRVAPRLAPIGTVLLMAGTLVPQIRADSHFLRTPELANVEAANIASTAQRDGARACVLATSYQALQVYAHLPIVHSVDEAVRCDLVVALVPGLEASITPKLRVAFRSDTVLDQARSDGHVFSSSTPECVVASQPGCWTSSG